MPISSDILTKLRNNDSTLVHLDLSYQFNLHSHILAPTNEQDRLTDQDIIDLGDALTRNTHLKSLNLNKNKVGVLGITILATTRLEALSLSKNELSGECIDALMLHTMWTSLDVSGNLLDDADIAKLGELPKLSSLDVSENKVGPVSMSAFALNTGLKKLSVRGNKHVISWNQPAPLCIEALESNRTLEWLDISDNVISTGSFDALSGHPELQALHLERCYFFTGDYYHRANINDVIRPIIRLPKLTWLTIREMDPKDKDMDQAATVLASLSLQYLDISKVEMSALGAKALASSTTLTTLIARENYIGPYGFLALAKNNSIKHLDLSKNNMKISIINKPEIKQRNQAESEHIVQFGYNTGIMTEVMNAFEQNTTLKTLNMSDQIIPYPEYIPALQFANLIRNNTTIISLDISHVAYKVRDEVMNALAKNNTLRSISLSANLEIEANQEALSKNYNLMTIRCFTGFNQQLSPYALEMQARNRNFFTGTSLLMLYAMSGERTHYGTEKCDKVIGDINLLTYIASFYMHPNLAKKIHSSICSFFKRKSTDELESEGQNIKKQRVDAPQSSAQI